MTPGTYDAAGLGQAAPKKKARPKRKKPAESATGLSPTEKLHEHLEERQQAKEWLRRTGFNR